MTLHHVISESTILLTYIASPALRALILALVAGMGLAAFRVKAASLRLTAWTSVLYASLALPLLGWMLPPLSIPAPAFFNFGEVQAGRDFQPSEPTASVAPLTENHFIAHGDTAKKISPAQQLESIAAVKATSPAKSNEANASLSTATPAESPSLLQPHLSISWSTFTAVIYLAVAFFLLGRLIVGFIFSHRLVRSSQKICESRVTVRLTSYVRDRNLAFVPNAAESKFISVPLTVGVVRSKILLPATWRDWDDTKLDAVIAHELSHLVRRDALTQCLSLLHRAIFWFSPLAWWLNRHLVDLAEQASDEAALSSGADRAHYAKTLLSFFEALQATPGRVWWQGVSMAKAGQAEQRVERILSWKGSVTMNLKKPVIVLMVILAVPVVYLAASARPSGHIEHIAALSGQIQSTGAGVSVTPEPTAPAEETAREDRDLQSPPPAVAPVAPTTPAGPVVGIYAPAAAAPMPPTAAIAPPVPANTWSRSSSSSGVGYSYGYGYGYGHGDYDDQRFVIVTGNSDSLTMSGSSMDARHVQKLRKQIPGDFIWFQKDEESYIIRDQATVDRARKLWAPQEELGRKQEELGKQQEALGKQQEELGARMEKVQVKVPDMTAALDRLKAKLQKLGSNASMEQISDLQSEIGELQSKIGDIQSQAGEQQGKLGEEQGALGEKQGKLGEQQGELGRQQAELAEKASHEMKQLLDEALTKGTAQPEAKTVKSPTL